jgi:acyl-CoA reductase-like NAD-dependent aldehyde dehydrogenase
MSHENEQANQAAGAPADAHGPQTAALLTIVPAGPPPSVAQPLAPVAGRLRVQKTYKMFVGGQFIRSESGRYTQVIDVVGEDEGSAENIARASRKDGRDAVKAAHGAWSGWSGKTAYNRGQILYRLAEVMEGRAAELAHELRRSLGLSVADARAEVDRSIDRVIAFAGWSDKYQGLLSSSNPVAGPHFNFSVSESMGVVVVVAPARPSLLGLVTAILPVIVSGNTALVLASEADPRTAITFSECLATSDLPGGVVNLLTGPVAEVAPHLARHQEVAALDLWLDDDTLATALESDAVATVKRVRRHQPARTDFTSEAHESLRTIERFVELKTIWHPVGV